MMKRFADFGLDDYINALRDFCGQDLCLYDIRDFSASYKLHLSKKQRIHGCPYCMAVKKSPAALAECIREEHAMLQDIPENTPFRIRRCHAGIVQMILPLRLDGDLLGGIFWGMRFLKGRRPNQKFLRAFARRYDLDIAELTRCTCRTPETTLKALRDSSTLLFLLRDHILSCSRNKLLEQNLARSFARPSEISAAGSGTVPTPRILRHSLSPEIRSALELVEKNYKDGVSREEIAEKVGLNPSHFSRRFKHETGISFRSYLQECRICAAAYMIKHSKLRVENIAMKLGFSSSAAFNRSFRALTGFSPRRFMFSNAEYPWSEKTRGDEPF